MKKATVVFIQVPVSILNQLEVAVGRESNRVFDAARELLDKGDYDGYKIKRELNRKLDKVALRVAKKIEKHCEIAK